MHKSYLVAGAMLAGVSVALGALGSHALSAYSSTSALSVYETGVRYQFYHSIALLATGILYERFRNKPLRLAGYFFMIGILLFSGSLYVITWLRIVHYEVPAAVGILTPIGGLLFMAGWVAMITGVLRQGNPLKSV